MLLNSLIDLQMSLMEMENEIRQISFKDNKTEQKGKRERENDQFWLSNLNSVNGMVETSLDGGVRPLLAIHRRVVING